MAEQVLHQAVPADHQVGAGRRLDRRERRASSSTCSCSRPSRTTSAISVGVELPHAASSGAVNNATVQRSGNARQRTKQACMHPAIKASNRDRCQALLRRKFAAAAGSRCGETGSLFRARADIKPRALSGIGATLHCAVWHDRSLSPPGLSRTVRVIAGTVPIQAGHSPAGRSRRQRRDHPARARGLQRVGCRVRHHRVGDRARLRAVQDAGALPRAGQAPGHHRRLRGARPRRTASR